MRSVGEIFAIAAERKGGPSAVEAALATTPARERSVVAAITDDRILAEMTRRVFNAGFSSKVIDTKWPAFEAAFNGFDPIGGCWTGPTADTAESVGSST